MQIKDALHQQFPHLEISGGNYPTPASKALLAQLVQVVQFSLIGVTLAGDHLFTHLLHYPPNGPFPHFYEQIREKRMIVGMGTWIIGNSVTQGLTSTGAFEVYFNGQVLSSKLNPSSAVHADVNANVHGGVPSLQHIIQQMYRIDPTLVSRRAEKHRSSSSSSRKSSSTSSGAHQQPQPEIDDINRDVRDLSYDDL